MASSFGPSSVHIFSKHNKPFTIPIPKQDFERDAYLSDSSDSSLSSSHSIDEVEAENASAIIDDGLDVGPHDGSNPNSPPAYGQCGGFLYHVFQKKYKSSQTSSSIHSQSTSTSSTATSSSNPSQKLSSSQPRADETLMRGTYPSLEAAQRAAKTMLRWDDEDAEFIEYAEYNGQSDWAHGDDVLVRAVGTDGEVCILSLMREPWDVWY